MFDTEKYNPQLGADEWRDTLERLVEWCDFLELSPSAAFERLAKILEGEHFGVEHVEVEHFDDIDTSDPPSMEYLNCGEAYATTLILTNDYIDGEKLIVCSWGDWIQSQEQWIHNEYSAARCGNCSHWMEGSEHYRKCCGCSAVDSSAEFQEFWNGYLVALAFTATQDNESGNPVNEWSSPGQDIRDIVTADQVEQAIGADASELQSDCIDFLNANLELMRPDVATLRSALLQWGIDHPGRLDSCPDDMSDDDIVDECESVGLIRSFEDLGADFHFTRNGHGVGFWDRYPLLFADKLSEAAEVYGSAEVHQSEDGEFYVMN